MLLCCLSGEFVCQGSYDAGEKKKKSIVNPTVRIRGKLQLQHVDRAEHVEQTAGWKVHGLKWWQPPLTRQGRPCSDESVVLRAKMQDIR